MMVAGAAVLVAAIAFVRPARFFGTNTGSQSPAAVPAESNVRRAILSWTSDGSGNAGGTVAVNGTILRVTFVPDAVAAPTAGYDVTLTDEGGIDVLDGSGADLGATTPKTVTPVLDASDGLTKLPICVADTLTLAVANAGNAKAGRVIIYHR